MKLTGKQLKRYASMRKAQAPDTRPALAFDTQQEVYIVKQALNDYKSQVGAFHQEKVDQMIDEVDHVIEMFENKEN
jgi:hypothetical protein